jgi:hypothetical protein
MTRQPPADWYQDPADPTARRFWDGDEWTALVAGAARSAEVESSPAVEYAESSPAVGYTEVESSPAVEYAESSPAVEYAESSPAVAYAESSPAVGHTEVESLPAVEYAESSPAVGYAEVESSPAVDERADESSPAAKRPPAGWYQDPADVTRRRYWDGTAWANRLLTRTTTSASPIVPTPGPRESETGSTPRETPMTRLVSATPAAPEASSTATAIASLMATVDNKNDGDGADKGRSRRIVLLLLVLLAALVATAAIAMTEDEPARTASRPAAQPTPESTPPASVPDETREPRAEAETPGPAVGVLYDACQEVVKRSSLSTDVRLVFQPVEDITVARADDRSQLEFWVRERGNRDEDLRIGFVCLVGDETPAEPHLYMQL